MEKQHSQDTERNSFEVKTVCSLIDQESSSMVQKDDGFDIEPRQDSDDGKTSEAYVVQPDDVMTLQVIPDSSIGQGSSSDEMLFPAKGVVYEFPKDPDESRETAVAAEFFDSPTASAERHLTVQVQGSIEKFSSEERLIVVESPEVFRAAEVTAAQSTMGSDQDETSKQGSDRNPGKRTNQAADDSSDDPRPDSDQDEPRVLTSSSDELVDARENCPEAAAKRRKPNPVENVKNEELSDEGSLADTEDSGSSSGAETEDRQTHVPIAAGLFGPGGVFGVPKGDRPPEKSLFITPGSDKIGDEQNDSNKLFKESELVKKPKHIATSGVATDLFTIKEDVAEKKSTGKTDNTLYKETHLVQSTKHASTSNVSTGPPASKKAASNVNRTGPKNTAGSFRMPVAGTTPEVATPSKSRTAAGFPRIPAARTASDPGSPKLGSGGAPEPGPSSAPSTSKSGKMKAKVGTGRNRCGECNARLGLTAIQCRCGNHYCAKHRYDKDHNCPFDYRAMGAEEIRRNNPTVVAEKVRKI